MPKAKKGGKDEAMKNGFKKLTALILAGILAAGMGTTVFAESKTPGFEANMNSRVEEVLDHAKKDLFIHLSMFDIDMENVAVTSVYPLNCLNQEGRQAYICFAVKENRIIGEMYIDKLPDGEFTSSFGLYDYPDVEKAITEEKPIAFACDDFSLYLLTDDSITPILTDIGQEGNVIENRQVFSNVSLSPMKILPLIDVNNCEIGWNEIDGARYYVKKDGTLATSSLTINGIRYKFDKNGACQGKYTGYTKSGKGKRYWKNGELVKDKWIKVKGERKYYAGADGYFVTGTRKISGKEYDFAENGALKK